MSLSASANSQILAEKEQVRQQLISLVNTELRQRPVTSADVDAFRRFAIPALLHNAQGRSLSEAEARAITAMMSQSEKQTSLQMDAIFQNSEAGCDCRYHQCPECGAASFKDYGFGPLFSDYTNVQRSGKINQIRHSIFLPQSGRSQQQF